MRKEAEVNHAYILGCKSQYFFPRYLGSDLASQAGVFWGARLRLRMKDCKATWDPYNSVKLTAQIGCHTT